MVITITASTTSNGISITAPGGGTLASYLSSSPKGIAVSIPTTATGTNLSAIGKTSATATDSVWRIRNGNSTPLNATLSSYGGGFAAEFVGLPSGTDTFVVSSVWTTHRLQAGGTTYVKAAGSQVVSSIYTFNGSEQYSINGSSGNDSLTGANAADTLNGNGGNDTLTGLGGNDTLTGGTGRDRFVFTNQGEDSITDFSATDDVFAISSTSYGVSLNSVTLNNVLNLTVNTNIVVDSLVNIKALGAISVNARFAYDTTNNQLLYDSDGIWLTGNTVVAKASVTGTLSASNFAFV